MAQEGTSAGHSNRRRLDRLPPREAAQDQMFARRLWAVKSPAGIAPFTSLEPMHSHSTTPRLTRTEIGNTIENRSSESIHDLGAS
jgi:hypothetical protein